MWVCLLTPPLCFSSSKASDRSSVALAGLVKQSLQLLLGGSLLLLHQVSVAFGDSPAIRCGHGGAEGATRGGLQLLPVVTAGPKKRNGKLSWKQNSGYNLEVLWENWNNIYLALTQGLVCNDRPLPQVPCFSDPAGRQPRSASSSSAKARMWYGSNPQQPPM